MSWEGILSKLKLSNHCHRANKLCLYLGSSPFPPMRLRSAHLSPFCTASLMGSPGQSPLQGLGKGVQVTELSLDIGPRPPCRPGSWEFGPFPLLCPHSTLALPLLGVNLKYGLHGAPAPLLAASHCLCILRPSQKLALLGLSPFLVLLDPDRQLILELVY